MKADAQSTYRLTFGSVPTEQRLRLLRACSLFLASTKPEISKRLEHEQHAQGDPISLLVFGTAPVVIIAIEELVKALAERGDPPPVVTKVDSDAQAV